MNRGNKRRRNGQVGAKERTTRLTTDKLQRRGRRGGESEREAHAGTDGDLPRREIKDKTEDADHNRKIQ